MELNQEQQAALDAILTGKNVFLSGAAGTGKTCVIRELLRRRPDIFCVAPTGLAARNIEKAETIHRFFQFPTGLAYPPEFLGAAHPNFARLTTRKSILIDEISMVRSDVFMAMEETLRHYAPVGDQQKPFGGRQIIAVGDFFQLPPVVPREYQSVLYRNCGGPYAFNTAAWENANFRGIELKQVCRQTDLAYIKFLNGLRTGDWHSAEYLRRSAFKIAETTDKISHTLCLCCTKNSAESINKDALARVPGPVQWYHGRITGEFPVSELPVKEALQIKIGCRVMILANGCSDDGEVYVNGDTGIVTGCKKSSVTVKLDRGPAVCIASKTWQHYEISQEEKDGKLRFEEREVGQFRQLPLTPFYATTIHKTQGLTLDRVHFVLGRGCFASGQLYTALSRVRSFDNLTLDRTLRPDDLIVDPMVKAFMAQFDV